MAKNNIKDSKIKKIITILLTSLILLIPTGFISNIISNRTEYKNEAIENIAKSWAKAQIISTPEMELNNKQKFSLNMYDTKINIEVQIRKKGVFKIPVYIAHVSQKGSFNNPYGKIANKNVQTKIQISDSRGFVDEPQFNINNSGFKTSQESFFNCNLITNSNVIPFEINYKIKGINYIKVILGGKKNNISIKGDWKDPSFYGDYLPTKRNITNKDFSAEWNIPKIAIEDKYSGVEVSLLVLNDNYKLAEKSLKYAFLLLTLIFTGYYIFEITSKENKKIHPIQYCLLGITMLMFYLLLISMSELIPFNLAYLFSALMVICLICTYTFFVITKKKDLKFSFGIASLIGIMYLFFYILLKLQDVALLSGSIGLFILIGIIMYFTRNVNWYNETEE